MAYDVTLSIKFKKCFCNPLIIKDLRWGPTFCKSLRIKDLCKEGPQRNSLEDNDLRWFFPGCRPGCQAQKSCQVQKKNPPFREDSCLTGSVSGHRFHRADVLTQKHGSFCVRWVQLAVTASIALMRLRPLVTRFSKRSRLKVTCLSTSKIWPKKSCLRLDAAPKSLDTVCFIRKPG